MKKIYRFNEYILEDNQFETPETYVSLVLKKLKTQIDSIFDYDYGEKLDEPEEVDSGKKPEQARVNKKDSDKLSFKDLGVSLQSSDISKYSKMNDNLTIKFVDSEFAYTLIVFVDIEDATPGDDDKDFGVDDVKKCYIKFKKYDLDNFDLLGQITKNIKIKDIDETFLINLKIELDENFGSDEEEFEIS